MDFMVELNSYNISQVHFIYVAMFYKCYVGRWRTGSDAYMWSSQIIVFVLLQNA